MDENVITIGLDDVLGPDGLDGAWEAMTRKLADRAESKFLHSDSGRSFHKAAVEAINEGVKERLASKVAELIDKPIYPTSVYGERKGEPTSFDQMIADAVRDAMTVKVDAHGRPDRHGKTTIQWALQVLVLEGLSTAVKAEVRKVNAQAKEAVGKEVAKAIAATIRS